MNILYRLMQATVNYNAATWAVSHYGQHLDSSTTTLYVPPAVYERLCKASDELRDARHAAMERAFL